MVCIAAFIILCLVGIFVLFASIFNHSIGARYLKVFKKALGCVGKKVRLQKCETNFKEDVSNSLLKKVVLKHPKLVRPLSWVIQVVSILLVVITVWSLVEVVKAGLALWTFGTCNVSQPAACTLSSESCSIDGNEPKNPVEYVGRWFEEWGEIFMAIPDRLHEWKAEDYALEPYVIAGGYNAEKPYALDILDPGCAACMQSYRNQKNSGFFDTHNVILMPYAIQSADGEYKFPNSEIIVRYLYATTAVAGPETTAAIIDRMFTGSNEAGVNYQTVLRDQMDKEEVAAELRNWLANLGLSKQKVAAIAGMAESSKVGEILQQTQDIVVNRIHAKGIPTLIYDGRVHTGLFENDG